jgi:membrane associated rhomboid family serine protease
LFGRGWHGIEYPESSKENMGLYDRDYTQADFKSGGRYGQRMRMAMPPFTPVVKWLLIVNFSIFLFGLFFLPRNIYVPGFKPPLNLLEKWFSVFPRSPGYILHFWRLITYQFLHDGIFHIGFNMLWLYFLGPTLERHWGSRKFLIFYLVCGAAGGVFYTLLVVIKFLPPAPMIGASGAILGIVAACAILFPQIVVYLFPLPVAIPIRVAALAGIVIYILFLVTRGQNAGGHAAHLAGMVAGGVYVFSQSWRDKFRLKLRSGSWQKKRAAQRNLQAEVDRILEKVHNEGIQSLTMKEKRILRQATRAEQTRNKL